MTKLFCLGGVRSNVSLQGKIENIDGFNYIRFDNITLKIEIDRGRIELRNLFGGDKNLGKSWKNKWIRYIQTITLFSAYLNHLKSNALV